MEYELINFIPFHFISFHHCIVYNIKHVEWSQSVGLGIVIATQCITDIFMHYILGFLYIILLNIDFGNEIYNG